MKLKKKALVVVTFSELQPIYFEAAEVVNEQPLAVQSCDPTSCSWSGKGKRGEDVIVAGGRAEKAAGSHMGASALPVLDKDSILGKLYSEKKHIEDHSGVSSTAADPAATQEGRHRRGGQEGDRRAGEAHPRDQGEDRRHQRDEGGDESQVQRDDGQHRIRYRTQLRQRRLYRCQEEERRGGGRRCRQEAQYSHLLT